MTRQHRASVVAVLLLAVGEPSTAAKPGYGDIFMESDYSGIGSCSAGQFVSALARNAAPTCGAPTGGGAPTTSTYLLQIADAALPNAQAMGVLGTGLVKNTTTTGVQSIAVAGTDYCAVTSGSALLLGSSGSTANYGGSGTCSASNWITALSASGTKTCAQPAFTDISGSVAATQLPNPSATTLGGVESLASATHKWINTISTGGVPSATQPDYSDLTGTIKLSGESYPLGIDCRQDGG